MKDPALKTTSPSVESEDKVPLETLYGEYAPQGRRYATAMLRHPGDAEEATHEAFVRLMSKFPDESGRLIQRSEFAPLFFTTLRNLCVDEIRKRKRRPNVNLDQTAEPVSRAVQDSRQLEKRLAVALEKMPEPWAESLQLKLNGELSYEEIAKVMESTHAQVRTWIYRARRFLESELKEILSER